MDSFFAVAHTQKIAEKRRLFTAAIAHDLRTPLAEIEARAELLSSENAATSRNSERVSRLRERIRSFGALLDNLILAAKITSSGNCSLEFTRGAFGEISQPIFERLADQLEFFGLDLDVHLSPEAAKATVSVSPTALEHIF